MYIHNVLHTKNIQSTYTIQNIVNDTIYIYTYIHMLQYNMYMHYIQICIYTHNQTCPGVSHVMSSKKQL